MNYKIETIIFKSLFKTQLCVKTFFGFIEKIHTYIENAIKREKQIKNELRSITKELPIPVVMVQAEA